MHVSKVYEMPVDAYGDVRTLVRGLPYQCPDDWEDVLDSLDEDSNLYLVKETDNPKDKLAIAAYLDDRRVGYVAASDNGKIWLYLTDEKMPCKFIERFDASFKISFENPRYMFVDMPFEEIYRDKDGVTDKPFPEFEIPFLTNPKDNNYEWLDDRTYIMDLEKFIPDFRRKLATRMIILVGRKNSKGEYCYYLPYANNIIADIHNEEIKDTIDEYGFVIALPDVPMMTERGGIFMDLHVTYLTGIIFWTFDSMHQSEFVFHLREDIEERPKTKKKESIKKSQHKKSTSAASVKKTHDEGFCEVSDDPEGGKHVSMGDGQDNHSTRPSISEEVFSKFISDNIGCDVLNAPNSSWKYDTTDFLGNGSEMYETYIFKKPVSGNPKCKDVQVNVVKGDSVNLCIDIKMNKKEIFDFVYRYKKLFFPDYTLVKCKKEYGNEEFSIYTEGITPSLSIRFPFMGDPCSMIFYTSFCNKAYIGKQKAKGKILTLQK